MYEKYLSTEPRSTSDAEWRERFLSEIAIALERRIDLILEWSRRNILNLPQESNEVIQWRADLKRSIENLRKQYRICSQTCKSCNLTCVQLWDHDDKEHTCLTDHMCDRKCDYRKDHEELAQPVKDCSLPYVAIALFIGNEADVVEPNMKVIMFAILKYIPAAHIAIPQKVAIQDVPR